MGALPPTHPHSKTPLSGSAGKINLCLAKGYEGLPPLPPLPRLFLCAQKKIIPPPPLPPSDYFFFSQRKRVGVVGGVPENAPNSLGESHFTLLNPENEQKPPYGGLFCDRFYGAVSVRKVFQRSRPKSTSPHSKRVVGVSAKKNSRPPQWPSTGQAPPPLAIQSGRVGGTEGVSREASGGGYSLPFGHPVGKSGR